MVKCGTIREPASIDNLTIWGIFIFVIMAVLGVNSLICFIEGCKFEDYFGSIWLLLGSGFVIAGLFFEFLSLNQESAPYMRISSLLLGFSLIGNTIAFICCYYYSKKIYINKFSQLLLAIFLSCLFFKHSKHSSLNQSFEF